MAVLPSAVNPQSKLNRFVELDALRGLAALFVLLHHGWWSQPIQPSFLRWIFEYTPLKAMVSGHSPVIFFFVLSGFVLTRAFLAGPPASWLGYMMQRSVRLGLPVVAALFASWLLLMMTWNGPLPPWEGGSFMVGIVWPSRPTTLEVLRQALLLEKHYNLDPVLWSLMHEWRFSMLLPAAILLRDRPNWLLGIGGLSFGSASAIGLTDWVTPMAVDLAATMIDTLYFLLPFLLGCFFAMVKLRLIGSGLRWTSGLAVLFLASLDADAAAIVGSVLLILLALSPGPLLGWLHHPSLVWLGQFSFSLYLIHLPLLAALVHLLHGWWPITLIVALGIMLSFPAAILFYHLVEMPAHRLARRIR